MKSVYLDTQHISRCASNRNRISELFSQPGLSFYYSLSHVIECLPKTATENEGAIKCLEIVMAPASISLAGWSFVAEIERSKCSCALDDIVVERRKMLFPDFSINRKDRLKKIGDGLKEVLARNVPYQNQRGSLQARFLKHGRPTAAAFQFLRAEIKKHEARISSEIPQLMPLLGANGLYDFLEGKTSEAAFAENFIDAVASPVALAKLSTMPDLAEILAVSKFFWTQMDEFAEIISRLISNLVEAQSRSHVIDYKELRSHFEEYLSSERYVSAITYRVAGQEISAEALKSMPGTRLFVGVSAQYILEKLDEYANVASNGFGLRPKFKRSDIADLTHVFYCPYVDVFGCDGAMRERLRRVGWRGDNIVTGDPEVEEKLANLARVG